MYTPTCTHTHTHTHTHARTHTQHIHTHTYTHAHHTYTHMHTHTHKHIHTYAHTCAHQSTFTGGGTFSTTFFVGVTVVPLATGCLTSGSLLSTDTIGPFTDDDDDGIAGACTGDDTAVDCCNLFNRFSLTSSVSCMTDEDSGNK